MRSWIILGVLAIGMGLVLSGCATKHACSHCTTHAQTVVICDDCGKTKGSAECCADTATEEAAVLCDHCGEVLGSEACCKPEGREICDHCGKFKGSPGCCKP